MSGKHTTKTEMRGTTSRHGKRADAKRLANKARRREDDRARRENNKFWSAVDREAAKINAFSYEIVIIECEKLLVENDAEIMRRVKTGAEISSLLRKTRDLLEALREMSK